MRIYSLLLLIPMALLHAQTPSRTLDGDIVDSVTCAPIDLASAKAIQLQAGQQVRSAGADIRRWTGSQCRNR